MRHYAALDAPHRAAHQHRLAGWEAPVWAAHFDAALTFLEELAPA